MGDQPKKLLEQVHHKLHLKDYTDTAEKTYID